MKPSRVQRSGSQGAAPAASFPADSGAASPLTVIATFVLVAVGITALAVYLLVDTTTEAIEVQEVRDGGQPAFEVTRVAGAHDWDDVEVRFLDAAGNDRADLYLSVPTGQISAGDRITLARQPPAGTYLLVLQEGKAERARLAVDI